MSHRTERKTELQRKVELSKFTHAITQNAHGLLVDRATSRRMAGIRQSGTKPELAVRQILRSLGLRYTLSNRDLPGNPDLANRSKRWAIFVHGCFWHRHLGCKKATTPKRNAEFWTAKFEANVARDALAIRKLNELGIQAITIWECELNSHDAVRARLSSFV